MWPVGVVSPSRVVVLVGSERTPNASDERAKLIVLTDLGYEALQDAFDTIIGIEADLEVLLGRDGLVQFRRVLSQVAVLPTG